MDVKLYDGTDHTDEYPEALRDALTYDGHDLTFEMSDGRVVTASYTYWTVVQKMKELLATVPEGHEHELLEYYNGYYRDAWTKYARNVNRFDLRFLEDPTTGILSFVDASSYYFQPGDIVHTLQRYDFRGAVEANYAKTTYGQNGTVCRTEDVDGSWGDCKNTYYLPLDWMKHNGELVPEYNSQQP